MLRSHICRYALPLIPVLAILLAAGCQRPLTAQDDILEPGPHRPTSIPAYEELVERYNDHVIRLDQLWSSTRVAMRWVDEDGRSRFEQGDGQFIYRRPNDIAMTVGQLGQTVLWAGSNDERYWLFDLQGERTALVGRHEFVGRPCARPLPYPVSPRAMPYLLGLLPLAPAADTDVIIDRNYYRIDPPDTGVRMWLDPETFLPVRVDLLDDTGQSVVAARLWRHERVSMTTVDRANWPRIASAANIYVLGEEGYLSLSLDTLSDGRARNQVRDQTFDFEVLRRAHRPSDVVVLDADCR